MAYRVFVRNWWKEADPNEWPDGLEPDSNARETTLHKSVDTEQEARELAKEYNRTHEPGRLSRKAEFDEIR